jgi:hypothetical protein
MIRRGIWNLVGEAVSFPYSAAIKSDAFVAFLPVSLTPVLVQDVAGNYRLEARSPLHASASASNSAMCFGRVPRGCGIRSAI